jgi:hypothetical protein
MQSALKTEPANGRGARTKRKARSADVSELLLAELAERRLRLQELLRMLRKEVAREMASGAAMRMPCRANRGATRAARAN